MIPRQTFRTGRKKTWISSQNRCRSIFYCEDQDTRLARSLSQQIRLSRIDLTLHNDPASSVLAHYRSIKSWNNASVLIVRQKKLRREMKLLIKIEKENQTWRAATVTPHKSHQCFRAVKRKIRGLPCGATSTGWYVARRHVGQAGDGTAVNAGGHLLLLTPPTGHGASHDVAGGRVLNPGRRAGPMSPLARERESPRTDGASRCSPCARVGSVDAGGDKVRTVCPVQETGVQYPRRCTRLESFTFARQAPVRQPTGYRNLLPPISLPLSI
jgi:hypothetical protein